MPNFSSSKRFAQAIYAIAKETDTVSDWVKNLESVNDILSEKDLVATLNSPNPKKDPQSIIRIRKNAKSHD